jgi:hypothetical protein
MIQRIPRTFDVIRQSIARIHPVNHVTNNCHFYRIMTNDCYRIILTTFSTTTAARTTSTTTMTTSQTLEQKIHTNKTTVWERQAKSIQNIEFENSKYLDTLRSIHDPSLHIKTIEDEIKGKQTNKQTKQKKTPHDCVLLFIVDVVVTCCLSFSFFSLC